MENNRYCTPNIINTSDVVLDDSTETQRCKTTNELFDTPNSNDGLIKTPFSDCGNIYSGHLRPTKADEYPSIGNVTSLTHNEYVNHSHNTQIQNQTCIKHESKLNDTMAGNYLTMSLTSIDSEKNVDGFTDVTAGANLIDSTANFVHSSTNHGSNGSNHNQNIPEKMSRTNLYIKGLPESFDDEKLWNLPPEQSQIKSVKAATDEDGKCRGYGFIDFVCEESANHALRFIRETHSTFTIKFAKENEKDKTNLYVTNLPRSWTTKDSERLKCVFERFGPIQSAFVMMERTTNRTTGVGFVRFLNERDALHTLESLKREPLILPECTAPMEAKFADKHNPETRRRRHPASALLTQPTLNNLIGYPLTLNGGTPIAPTQDAITMLLQSGLPLHSPHHAPNSANTFHTISNNGSNRKCALTF